MLPLNSATYQFHCSNCLSNNDINNKDRETIICNIINNNIPEDFYKNIKWANLKKQILNYLEKLKPNYKKVECRQKGGRKYKYDFDIIFDNDKQNIYKIEWKNNAVCINDTPQFVSPMKPSQYMSSSYEKYYYDNWLPKLLDNSNFDMPDENDYMKQIHSTEPECIKSIQEKYYKGSKQSSKFTNIQEDIDFYRKSNSISKNSIENFIKNTDLDYNKLTNYLLETQKNKYYMLYKNGEIHLENINTENYKILSYIKESNRYVATTQTGIKLNILLRWKNGNGIAYPAFQIS